MQNAFEVIEMRRRTLGITVRRVKINRRGRLRTAPRPLLTRIDPQTPRLRPPASGIKYWNACVVGEEMVGRKDISAQTLVQGFKPPTGAADPAAERRAFDFNAMTGKDLRLPIERRVIAILADKDMCEKRRRCEAAGNRSFRRRGLRDFASPAGYFGRVIRITRSYAGTQSSISDSLTPMRCIDPPQHGQASLGISSTTSSRGR